jgi:hypothetical protein
MFWPVALSLASVLSWSSMVQADELAIDTSTEEETLEPATTPQPDQGDSQEIGALLGVAMGGNVTPGGLAVEGRYLYRLSELDWLETGVHFNLGSGSKECFRDRQSTFVCEHGLLDGFAAEGSVGLRRYFVGQQQFRPYVRGGVGVELISYTDDEVTGIGLPFYLGAGIRVEVANRVLVVADATTHAGVAFLNKSLGTEPNLSLSIAAGVEFTLE